MLLVHGLVAKENKFPPLEIISGVETWSMAHGEGQLGVKQGLIQDH